MGRQAGGQGRGLWPADDRLKLASYPLGAVLLGLGCHGRGEVVEAVALHDDVGMSGGAGGYVVSGPDGVEDGLVLAERIGEAPPAS